MPAEDHLLHFWSLAVEEQFYLIWPVFLYFFLNKKIFLKIILLLVPVIIIVRSILYINHPAVEEYQYYFYNTFCRMDGFIIGGYLFLLQQKKVLTHFQNYFFIPLLLIIIGIYFTNTKQVNPFISTIGYSLLALFFAGLINVIIINPASFLSKIFKIRWIKYLGRISYGLYIYHWLVLRILQPKFMVWLDTVLFNKHEMIYWLSLIMCLVISIAISTVSYFYFEVAFLRLKK